MKTTIFITCFITVAIFFSCSKNSENSDTSCTISQVPKDSLVDTANMVPLNDAITDISNYVRMADSLFLQKGGNPDSLVRSYTIGKADLLGVLGMKVSDSCKFRYDKCRVYIGLRATGIKSIQKLNGKADTTYMFAYKLYMTPVDHNGNDLFFNTKSSIADTAGPDSYVLDLITPCPKTCDVNSPLYSLVRPR